MPTGPSFYRYNGDGYGEHKDGKPYDGSGVGRLWPLLTGERAHYALAAREDPQPYLDAMNRMTGPGGLIPEQVWDSEAIADRHLFPGKPSGSAMPLVWAHAEFLKVLSAKSSGRPIEMFDAVLERWGRRAPEAATWFWRPSSPFDNAPAGRFLRFEADQQFSLSYRIDEGDEVTAQAELGLFNLYGVSLSRTITTNASKLAFRIRRQDGEENCGEIVLSS
jgi:glucoamylase